MNDFQKYVSQNKDRAKEVGPGVYRIPLIQEELTPSFKLNSPYMQGAENGGLYAFVDSTGNIIPNQDIEYDPSDNQYYKVHHLPDAKVEAPSLSAYNDPNYTNILTGNYYGHKFVPTEQNVKYYQKLYENDHKVREGWGPHRWAQLGGIMGVGSAAATAGAYAPTIAGWTYRTALPWFAENLAVPTLVAESIDLAQNALCGTTSSETVSNFLQDKLHVPQLVADIAGEATNPGWYVPSSYGVKLWNGAERLVTKGYNKFINPFFKRFTSDGWFTIGNKQYRPSMSTLSVGFPVVESRPAWKLEPNPGYQIKSLTTGSPLEKQLSKNGTISIKQLQAYINRNDVAAVDKEILNRVLSNHPNETHIDYNVLRKEAQGMIPKYTRVPQTKYEQYGMNRIGYPDREKVQETPLEEINFDEWNPESEPDIFNLFADNTYDEHNLIYKPETFTFESPGITGNTKHYPGNPLQRVWGERPSIITTAERMGIPKSERHLRTHGHDYSNPSSYGKLYQNGSVNPESNQFGKFIDEGSEALVFDDPTNPHMVLKVNTDWRWPLQEFYTNYVLKRNRVPNQKPIILRGITEEGFPVFNQEKVTPMTNDQYFQNLPKIREILHNKGFIGDPEDLDYMSNGVMKIGDFSPGNVAFDSKGNIVFIDIDAYKRGGKINEKC